MSEDEDDYLSDKFLTQSTTSTSSSSTKTYTERRKEALRLSAIKNEQNRKKTRRQLEQEALEEGLNKSLFERAKDEGEWELCKELARFLRALDEDGSTLQRALEDVGLAGPRREGMALRTSRLSVSSGVGIPPMNGLKLTGGEVGGKVIEDEDEDSQSGRDYFS